MAVYRLRKEIQSKIEAAKVVAACPHIRLFSSIFSAVPYVSVFGLLIDNRCSSFILALFNATFQMILLACCFNMHEVKVMHDYLSIQTLFS